jgi:uncharacterized Zn-finger protein
MDDSNIFSELCIAKNAVFIQTLRDRDDNTVHPSMYSLPPKPSAWTMISSHYGNDVNAPSAQSSLDGIDGEEALAWVCDMCHHYNRQKEDKCLLCSRDQAAAVSAISNEFDDNNFERFDILSTSRGQSCIEIDVTDDSSVYSAQPSPDTVVYHDMNIDHILDSSLSHDVDHSTSSTNTLPLVCPHPDCNIIFSDLNEIPRHCKSSHRGWKSITTMIEDGKQIFQCKFRKCFKVFSDKDLVKKHYNSKHREKTFVCHYNNCKKSFAERAKLKRHFLVHTQEKPFVCPYDDCGKRFGYNANLKAHLRIHNGNRPYSCSVAGCHRKFTQVSLRNNHVLTHQTKVNLKTAVSRRIALNASSRKRTM